LHGKLAGVDEEQIASLLVGRVLVLTGAGISVASGLPVFQGNTGLYHGLNPYDLASPLAFARHPVTVWNWYLMRIRDGIDAKPNAAHVALRQLEALAESVTIVTSNVDPLHQLAGSKQVYRLHGNILETLCTNCKGVDDLEKEFIRIDVTEETLPRCSCGGLLRPNVVWFGEYPWSEALEAVQRELPKADIVLEVGTSGTVSYGFSQIAAMKGIPVVRINPDGETEPGVTLIPEPSEIVLPRLIKKLV
jgi:NAD-dependent deacetylase